MQERVAVGVRQEIEGVKRMGGGAKKWPLGSEEQKWPLGSEEQSSSPGLRPLDPCEGLPPFRNLAWQGPKKGAVAPSPTGCNLHTVGRFEVPTSGSSRRGSLLVGLDFLARATLAAASWVVVNTLSAACLWKHTSACLPN